MKSYEQRLKEINDNAAQERKNLKAFQRAFPNLCNYAQTLEETRPFIYGINVSDYWGGSFVVSLVNLDGFKGMDLIDLLAELEQDFGVEFEMEDQPEYNRKVFCAEVPWHKGNSKRSLSVRVEATIKSDSALCHRVVIGETVETIRKPTYKLVCPD